MQAKGQAWYRLQIETDVGLDLDVEDLKKRLAATPHARMSLDERAELMAQLGDLARREGILELRQLLGCFGDDFLEVGVRLLVEGAEPQSALEVLQARKQTLMDQHRTRYRMVIEALLRVQAEERPALVEARVRSLI